MQQEEKKRRRVVILLMVIILLLSGITGLLLAKTMQPADTAVIVSDNDSLNDPSDGNIRVKMNTHIVIKEKTMQNLNFSNLNKDRLLKCRIAVDGEYIYESPYVETGNMIQADLIDTDKLGSGETDAVAEIYSYAEDTKQQIGHTNVEITLDV